MEINKQYLSRYNSLNARATALCKGDQAVIAWFESQVKLYGFHTALNNLANFRKKNQ
jgi:hypothetical protein